ncbi:myb-related protein Pp2-like [Physcomitrium patens]|uniref:Uncharacterized protein n=1 Tax=Physcomitrium patens TaxID=3218 RepID=A9SH57_PHYPA|nr:myb-related protein Pp2-like [Physcomitrium patens]XP_024384338.1 myb-related protein Pp2-like [Physcomitrium patens]XP_024384339.1 myb-related protein Pp2-like [Physcomitrium patens]XP_024384340.1 myb-related protein Pp2-like [Physcomitrium patens]XP_024384341.1 myb-related protein Pp2-like [Physcomitrium patens]PNR48287.1 hypothetical protein PHYPA_012762 [Physcomitrium patens]|eukprot:XP_024384337.1 myb-related protein Pp2-like [Physcomitrella patens]
MGRKPCCEKAGLKRGPWTVEEDQKLVSYITNNGLGCWRATPKLAGLLRCGKSCRLRWINYLRPDLKRGIFSEEEENLILDAHATLGNRWSRIAAQLPGRTDNEIKNYWNTRLKKRLRSQGLDPNTHLPLRTDRSDGTGGDTDVEDGDCSDATMSDATKSKIKVKRKAKFQETVKVRQPKGPKPAPQLKMCQSEEGPVLLKVSKCPQSSTRINPSRARNFDDDSEHSSSSPASSTITTKSAEDHQDSSSFVRSLTSAPSFPEAELWNCIKPSTNSITTGALLSDWDSNRGLDSSLPCPYLHSNTEPPKLEECKPLVTPPLTQGVSPSHDTMDIGMQRNMHVSSQPSLEVGENYCSIFQGTCFPQLEMDMSWTMEGEISHATPEPIFALAPPISAGLYGEVLPPAPRDSSQEMQRLAALLDLI